MMSSLMLIKTLKFKKQTNVYSGVALLRWCNAYLMHCSGAICMHVCFFCTQLLECVVMNAIVI